MDTTKEFTAIEWCAGYGGIHLGLKRAIPSLRVIAYGEIEAFACANLVAKMEAGLLDAAPLWTDIKTFPCEEFRDRVGLLVAGYPCQPFSAAGKRLGAEDPRHLWPHIARAIRVIRPRLCFFENVEGHISLGLREVLGDLGAAGYTAAWGIFSASEVGAPHQRKRVFILAYRIGYGHNWRELQDRVEGWPSGELPQPLCEESCGVWSEVGRCGQVWPSRPGESQHEWEPPRVVGNATEWQDHGRESRDLGQAAGEGRCGDDAADGAGEVLADTSIVRCDGRPNGISGRIWEPGEVSEDATGCGGEGNGMRQAQSALGRDADGIAGGLGYAELQVSCDNRTDELRLLGNGVVPATAERAFLTLMQELLKGTN